MLKPLRDDHPSISSDELRYRVLGSGTSAVVLLHGLFGGPDNWQLMMEELADSYRFFALQLPIDPHEDRHHKDLHSISQLTQYVERFVDEMELDNPVLCGNSLGGQIGIDFCLRNPGQVKGLVLAGSAGLFERNVTKGKGLRLCRDLIREQACEIFHDPSHVTDELVEDVYTKLTDRQYRRFLLKVSKATRDRYMLGELAEMDVPTLIVWGRNDSITPPFVAEEFHNELPHASLEFLDECGHAPPVEQPREFSRLLHAFLNKLPVSPG